MEITMSPRPFQEGAVPESQISPSVTATSAATLPADVAAALPAEINVNHLKDHVYMVVHDAMITITDEARARLALLAPPVAPAEEAHLQAITPEGFLVTLVTRRQTPAELIDAVTKMQGWLQSAGYQSLRPKVAGQLPPRPQVAEQIPSRQSVGATVAPEEDDDIPF